MSESGSAVYDQLQRENKRATRFLLIGSVLIVAVMVWVVAGALLGGVVLDPVLGVSITAIGTVLGLLFILGAYRSGPALALRAAKARPVSREEAPELHNLFDEVCVSAGILGRKPTLHLVDDPAPNAFATGRSLEDSHVAVTTGLIERLPRYELRAVLAHEVSHILNDDIRTVTLAVATAGLVALLADVLVRFLWLGGGRRGGRGNNNNGGAAQVIFLVLGLVAVVLAPLAAQVIRFAVSRQREYLADATAADILRDPQSMVNALRRIDEDHTSLARFEVATAHLWFEEPNDTDGGRGPGRSRAGGPGSALGASGVPGVPASSGSPGSSGSSGGPGALGARGRGGSGANSRSAKMARRFATHPSIQERVDRLAALNAGTVSTDAPLPPPPPPSTRGYQ